jgi:hypothetical protein
VHAFGVELEAAFAQLAGEQQAVVFGVLNEDGTQWFVH